MVESGDSVFELWCRKYRTDSTGEYCEPLVLGDPTSHGLHPNRLSAERHGNTLIEQDYADYYSVSERKIH
jgi:hypothetical protein